MSFNKRYVYRALIRIRSSWNEIISSGGKACSYQANTSFRYQCCDMIPNRLILCFERGLRPLNMKISISTVLLWSDRVLFIRKKCLKALPTCVNIESWNITAQELTFCRTRTTLRAQGFSHIPNLTLPCVRFLESVTTRSVWYQHDSLSVLSNICANCSQSISVLWISSWFVMTKGPYWKTVWSRGSPATFPKKIRNGSLWKQYTYQNKRSIVGCSC